MVKFLQIRTQATRTTRNPGPPCGYRLRGHISTINKLHGLRGSPAYAGVHAMLSPIRPCSAKPGLRRFWLFGLEVNGCGPRCGRFPRLGKSFGLCLATAPGLGCLDAQEGINLPSNKTPPRPEKISWPLSGRTCGFGKAAWGESVHDDFFRRPQKAFGLSGNRCGSSCGRRDSPMNFARPDR